MKNIWFHNLQLEIQSIRFNYSQNAIFVIGVSRAKALKKAHNLFSASARCGLYINQQILKRSCEFEEFDIGAAD